MKAAAVAAAEMAAMAAVAFGPQATAEGEGTVASEAMGVAYTMKTGWPCWLAPSLAAWAGLAEASGFMAQEPTSIRTAPLGQSAGAAESITAPPPSQLPSSTPSWD